MDAAARAIPASRLRGCESAPITTIPSEDTAVPAGHGRRIAATLLDAVFYALVVGACGTAGFVAGLAAAGATNSNSESDGWEDLGWVLLGSVLGIVVGVLAWTFVIVWLVRRRGPHNGQTFGKQLTQIRATTTDGTPIGAGRGLLREVLAKGALIWITSSAVSALFGFVDGGLIGLTVAIVVWYGPAFVDDQRRALHDRLAGTRVVDARRGVAPPVAFASEDELWPATP